jgi:hypothetical protein
LTEIPAPLFRSNRFFPHINTVIIINSDDNGVLCRKFELIFIFNMLQCILAAATAAARKIAKI